MNLREAVATGKPFRLPEWDCNLCFEWHGHEGFYTDDGVPGIISAIESKREDWELVTPKPKTKTMYQVIVTGGGPHGVPFISGNLFESLEDAEALYANAAHFQLLPTPIEVEVP